jgi:hypothetical protein
VLSVAITSRLKPADEKGERTADHRLKSVADEMPAEAGRQSTAGFGCRQPKDAEAG